MEAVLALNESYQPHAIIDWRRAVTLLFEDKVQVVETYDREIRSVSLVIKAPAVVRFVTKVRRGKRAIKFSRFNILVRDGFKCSYCGHRFPASKLNYDHVIPRSRGGKTEWTNVVAACYECNKKKGARTPAQAGMRLLVKPERPAFLPITMLRFERDEKHPPEWAQWLRDVGYWQGALAVDR